MISFKIPYPPTKKGKTAWNKQFGLNAYYGGKHWSVRKRDATFWHMLVKMELVKQGIERKYFNEPVAITMYFNSNLDVINNAGIYKMIEDGLKGYLLVDDDKRYVRKATIDIHDEPYILVEIQHIE